MLVRSNEADPGARFLPSLGGPAMIRQVRPLGGCMTSSADFLRGVLLGCVGLVASACDNAGGSVDECASSYTGTFDGDRQGTILGQLDPDASRLTLQFFLDGSDGEMFDFDAISSVSSSGAIEAGTTAGKATGTLDLDDCTASGDWDLFDGRDVGTFELEIRHQ